MDVILTLARALDWDQVNYTIPGSANVWLACVRVRRLPSDSHYFFRGWYNSQVLNTDRCWSCPFFGVCWMSHNLLERTCGIHILRILGARHPMFSLQAGSWWLQEDLTVCWAASAIRHKKRGPSDEVPRYKYRRLLKYLFVCRSSYTVAITWCTTMRIRSRTWAMGQGLWFSSWSSSMSSQYLTSSTCSPGPCLLRNAGDRAKAFSLYTVRMSYLEV